jgi:hypothetical protein
MRKNPGPTTLTAFFAHDFNRHFRTFIQLNSFRSLG